MQLQVNGNPMEFAAQLSAAQLLEEMGLKDKRVALMVNDAIVRRDDRQEHQLNEGDSMEIISMVGGG